MLEPTPLLTCALMTAGGALHTVEAFEDELLLGLGDANTGILHTKDETLGPIFGRNGDRAREGVLIRVADQIEDNLLQWRVSRRDDS